MTDVIARLLGRAGDLLGTEPTPILFLSAALVAVFLSTAFRRRDDDEAKTHSGVGWTIYRQLTRIIWASVLVALLVAAVIQLRSYLNHTGTEFRQTHGRVSEANIQAVRTIWGEELEQRELTARFWYDDEETERLKSEDPTRPEVVRVKKVRRTVTGNPFVTTRHEVTLRQNSRKKGSANYAGYEAECRFTYRLRNPAERDVNATLQFPLPSSLGMYDDLSVKINNTSAMDDMEIREGSLVVGHAMGKGESVDLEVSFKSRGLAYWYFQITEPREIRDFSLTLRLPDFPKGKLNYPEGCMTPTEIAEATDGGGCVLTYRLDRAISSKGMGIELPRLDQPGQLTGAVLGESVNGWLLVFAAVLLTTTLAGVKQGALVSVLMAAATAFGYGLLGNFSDLFLGFWGSFVVILLPLYALMGWVATRVLAHSTGTTLALQMVLFGLLYPCLAALDSDRQLLYLNIVGAVLLAVSAWQLVQSAGLLPGRWKKMSGPDTIVTTTA